VRRSRLLGAGLLAPPVLALGLFALSPVASAAPRALKASATVAKKSSKSPAAGPSVMPTDTKPSPTILSQGRTLFDENCSSCHGLQGEGSSFAPNLRGVGAGVPYLWISSGWMPLSNPTAQPITKPTLFTPEQTTAIAEYVGSFAPGGTPIFDVNLNDTSQSEGLDIFAVNCAGCHTITGAGDAISDGQFAPSLHGVDPAQVADAVRSGPGNMPRFSTFVISNAQLADLAAYITTVIKHPVDIGGNGLGGVGPVAEGFVGLFIGVGGCVLGALWIGERTHDDEDDEDGHGESHSHDASHDGSEVTHA
jgi:ubiquinol-cytochrome c reductase cytochrome c subunit